MYELLLNEKVTLSDFADWQQSSIQWLIERNSVIVSDDNVLQLVYPKIYILKDLYEHDVTCIYKLPMLLPTFDKLISAGELRQSSTLFTEPERDYLNYVLNKSEFSDGLDLRNKYIHSTYPQNKEEQKKDYITLLKIMVLIIVKINDELCTLVSQERIPL